MKADNERHLFEAELDLARARRGELLALVGLYRHLCVSRVPGWVARGRKGRSTTMVRTVRMGFVLLALAVVGAGCASSEQWKEWKSHSSHFASGDHMMFSLKNQGKTPKVSQTDQKVAAGQSWWGDPVVVRADQIFQN